MSADERFRRALAADAGVPYVPGLAGMKERDLSARVRELVEARGLRGFAFHDVHRRTAPGWPDWTIIGPSGLLHRELKSASGVLEPEQRIVGQLLTRHGCDWAVWRPAQLADGTIAAQLDAITPQRTERRTP